MRSLASIFLALTLPLAAQRGNRQGHDNMAPVVPEQLVPEAPVLTVEQALKSFEIAPGFTIEPVAAEPLVEKPVCLDFDSAGRLWVCEMSGYMPDIDGKLESEPRGKIVILEDTDTDGKIDKRSIFLDNILLPRAISVWEDGVLFIDEHRLCWVKRHGLKAEGSPKVIDPKFARGGNVEHKPNGLLRNLDNRLYLAKSGKYLERIGDDWQVGNTSFRGQWGIARDDYGRLYHNNNSTFLFGDLLAPNLLLGNPGAKMKYRATRQLGSNKTWPIRVTPGLNRAYIHRDNGYSTQTLDPKTHKLIDATAAAGMAIYRGTNFPKSWYNTAFVCESGANLVKAISLTDEDGKLRGAHSLDKSEFLASTDERFRPVNLYNSPDGSLYLLDMYHGIIQHKTFMTSYLREQTLSRGLDKPGYGHGRIYRIRSRSGKVPPSVDIAKLQGLDLVKMLMHPNSWHREMAQRVIVERKSPALVPFLEKLTTAGPTTARIGAIWTLEGMGMLKPEHLVPGISDRDPKLQTSALWATTRLLQPQIQQLAPILVRAKVAGEPLPYLARALAETHDDRALVELSRLLDRHRKQAFVREAAVSGLDRQEQDFTQRFLKKSKDKQLIAWLDQAGARSDDRTKGPGLEGAALASFNRGKAMFHGEAACFGCHGPDGTGLENLGPPLDGSEWVTGDSGVLINILLHGMTGPVDVAGVTYTPAAAMPGLSFNPAMTDQHLADIATYIRNEWVNKATPVGAKAVAKIRASTKERSGRPWTAAELK